MIGKEKSHFCPRSCACAGSGVKDKSTFPQAQIKSLAKSFAPAAGMSRAAVEAGSPFVDSSSAKPRAISDRIWEKNMTKKNIIHRAQWAGALALLSFVTYATVFANHGSSPALSFLRLT